MLHFFFLFSQRVQILKTAQIRPILHSSQPIRLQIFFRVGDNARYLKNNIIYDEVKINTNIPDN